MVWSIVVLACVLTVGAGVGVRWRGGRAPVADRRERVPGRERPKRILFPFVASALSLSALDAALRIARAEDATLVPVFLARVPMNLPLQAPLPSQSASALMLQEAIEQRAAGFAVAVDARLERGRDNRHALRQAIAGCRYDRIEIAAAVRGCPGFNAGDVAWLLENAPGEIIVLRAAGVSSPRVGSFREDGGRRVGRPERRRRDARRYPERRQRDALRHGNDVAAGDGR